MDLEDVIIIIFSLIILAIGTSLLTMKDHFCKDGVKDQYKESTKITGIVFIVVGAIAVVMQIRSVTRGR